MRVSHSPELWRDFPELAAGAVAVDGITPTAPVDARIDAFCTRAAERSRGRVGGGAAGDPSLAARVLATRA